MQVKSNTSGGRAEPKRDPEKVQDSEEMEKELIGNGSTKFSL